MALAFRSSAENSALNGGDVTVTHVAGIAANDVVYFAYAIGDNDGIDQNMAMITAGYTELADIFADSTNDTNFGVYRKIMGSTPDSTAQCDGLGGVDAAVAAVEHVWTGADQTTPEDATTTTATGITEDPPDSPSIVTVTANAVVIATGANNSDDTTVTAPSGYSNQIDITRTDDTRILIGMASKAVASPTTEDPAVWTTWYTDVGSAWAAATVAIRPAPEGQPTWKRWGGVKNMGGRRTAGGVTVH